VRGTHPTLACAEYGRTDVFLTTDDKIKRIGIRQAKNLKVRIENPLSWLSEVMNNE